MMSARTIRIGRRHFQSWADTGLHSTLVDRVKHLGLQHPTRIQSLVIPQLLEGQPTAIASETGSGKTLAYVLPVLHQLLVARTQLVPGSSATTTEQTRRRPNAVILVPTADLARQVAGVVSAVGQPLAVQVSTHPLDSHAPSISASPLVWVTTPAAVTAAVHARDLATALASASSLVVDEADHLLSGGYLASTESILRAAAQMTTSKGLMVAFAGATLATPRSRLWPMAIAQRLVPRLDTVRSAGVFRTTPTLAQEFVRVQSAADRLPAVLAAINTHLASGGRNGDVALVFTAKAAAVAPLASALADAPSTQSLNVLAVTDAATRAAAVAAISGPPSTTSVSRPPVVLVTTDALARGIDCPRIALVVHHTLAADAAVYLHRVGRTARAGRSGTSLALVDAKCAGERARAAAWEAAAAQSLSLSLDDSSSPRSTPDLGGEIESMISRNRSFGTQRKKQSTFFRSTAAH
ncbi:P-loop containing nucleoside triphosphate hydrolase protein [Blastocladiella britannica]|nr:P-loop containing nucleoside triphosphate hydrolase protein [Blastocladiella britannica]